MSIQSVAYHLYTLSTTGVGNADLDTYIGGLLVPTADPGAVSVLSGTHTGNIDLTLLVLDGPPDADIRQWEDVVEFWLDAPDREIGTSSMVGECVEAVLPHPGGYTLRACANNRDAGYAIDNTTDPVEQHLLALWPATRHEPRVLKTTSEFCDVFQSSPMASFATGPGASAGPGDDDPAALAATTWLKEMERLSETQGE